MKYITMVLLTVFVFYGYSLNITVEGVTDMGNITLSPFAILKGNIQFKVGNLTWYPVEIWMLPPGSDPSQFKSTGNTNELPANSTDLGKCSTNVYHNSTIGYAYKITSSNINKGSFCSAMPAGVYEVLAK